MNLTLSVTKIIVILVHFMLIMQAILKPNSHNFNPHDFRFQPKYCYNFR